MIAAMELLAAFEWEPGIRGLTTVVLSVLILCGSVALIVSTNSGARLGTLISVSALFGWLTVMGIVWAAYGIGWRGEAPTWKAIDIVRGDPAAASVEKAQQLPLLDDGTLPDPVELRDSNEEFASEFPVDRKDPTIGDLLSLDPSMSEELDAELGGWHLLAASDGFTGEIQSAAGVALGEDGQGLFGDASEYTFLETFTTGGNKARSDDSTVGRVIYRALQPFDQFHPPFLAAVQVQEVIPQTAKPGQAPPSPVRNPDAPAYTVIFERDRGNLRQPAIFFTIFSGIVFAVTANMLHRRDKLATAQRAAVAAGNG